MLIKNLDINLMYFGTLVVTSWQLTFYPDCHYLRWMDHGNGWQTQKDNLLRHKVKVE